jgi:hypothetical protein
MALVDVRINYFTPPTDGSKPYQWIDEVEEPRRVCYIITILLFSHLISRLQNWTPKEFEVKVENVRGREKEFTLDKAGFEFHTAPSREKDFEDEESIRTTYYEDVSETLKKLTGASRVAIFDHSEWASLWKQARALTVL